MSQNVEWIDCKKMLPVFCEQFPGGAKTSEVCLVLSTIEQYFDLASLEEVDDQVSWMTNDYQVLKNVTHWMKLPAPPNEAQNE